MHHGWHQRADESRNDFIEEIALDAITVVYQGHGTKLLELDIATKGGKQVIPDGGLAAHLEILDVADLLDGALVLFDMPVFVVLFEESFPVKGRKRAIIGQENRIVAWLVFQPCPKQFHVAEVLQPNDQAIVGNV